MSTINDKTDGHPMTTPTPTALEALRFRKKPVVVEAMQFTYPPPQALLDWCPALGRWNKNRHPGAIATAVIVTLEDGPDGEAKHVATEGDWIIKGVAGEFYPCKPDIFERTYEHAAIAAAEAAAPHNADSGARVSDKAPFTVAQIVANMRASLEAVGGFGNRYWNALIDVRKFIEELEAALTPPPAPAAQHLLQDTDKGLSQWLERDPNARQHARDAAEGKPRPSFLALAESCGARLTGKPDGSESITIVFTAKAWRAFDAATATPSDDKP